jgi:large subunit ribosomal protein L15
VNVGDLGGVFSAGAEVTPTALVIAKLIRRQHGAIPTVKILGTGEITIALKVSNCHVSSTAKAAIEKAGGSVAALFVKPLPNKPKKVQTHTAAPKEKEAPVKKVKQAPKPKKE